MKFVSSGKGNGAVPLLSLIAILAVSLTVNLPGLAISPLEGKLHLVFPHVSDLQIQLLEVLPNVVVIPFILLSGKISTVKNQIAILILGLVIYTLAGVAYLLATSLNELIVLGCLLGMGCGLVIPLATSLVAQYFFGSARVRYLGWNSGISNSMVIVGTLFVGWMAMISWHLAFVVYLVPLIPLVLMPWMTNSYMARHCRKDTQAAAGAVASATDMDAHEKAGIAEARQVKHPRRTLAAIVLLYVAMTYSTIVVSYFLPFTMQHYRFDSGEVGVATAMFYLAASVAGFMLPMCISKLRGLTLQSGMGAMILGLVVLALFHHQVMFCIGSFVIGFGYGVIQPALYDKVTYLAPDKAASTRYFSYLLSGNYIGISIAPFIVDFMARALGQTANINFSYWLNACVVGLFLAIALIKRRSFVFNEK